MNSLQLATALRSAVSALHKGLRRQMNSANHFSMTEMETIGLLVRLPALLPSELAARTHVKTQSMSQILNKLVKLGIVKRAPSKKDKRKVYISLTPAGKKLVEKTKYDRDEWLKGEIERSLTAAEKKLIEKVLPVLGKLAGTH